MPLITGSAANFIPEIWSKKLNARFYASTVLMQIANRNWEGEIKSAGSKVMIRQTPSINIGTYDPMSPSVSYQNLGEEKLELLIDQARSFAFKVDDVLKAQADINLINEATQDAAENMKIAVDRQVLGTIYADVASTNVVDAASSGNEITKDNILDVIITAAQKLDEQNIPESGRWLVLPPWMCAMIKKSDFRDASLAGDSVSIARNGRLGIVDRFTIYMSNNLAITDAAGKKPGDTGYAAATARTKVMAGTKHFLSFASQFNNVETLRLENQFGDGVRGLNVFGYKVVKPEAGVLLDAKKG